MAQKTIALNAQNLKQIFDKTPVQVLEYLMGTLFEGEKTRIKGEKFDMILDEGE